MKKTLVLLPLLLMLGLAAVGASAQNAAKLPSFTEEVFEPEAFTKALKEEWFFLKDETESLLKSIEKRGEFETSVEFDQRVVRTKADFIKRMNDHIKEKKLFRRVFTLLLKANLDSYDADKEVYSISCPEMAEVPYNIPAVLCYVPTNDYVGLSDTVANGYRETRIGVKLTPQLQWHVERPVAMQANGDQANMFFRIRLMLDLRQSDIVSQTKFRIVAKDIALYNRNTRTVYWKEVLQ
ncbi:MAG: hypothetical protein HY966_02820 [Ignavibacteriales bacterium]|nr:hypothetical protein [Ignavibacteriales bacterium]